MIEHNVDSWSIPGGRYLIAGRAELTGAHVIGGLHDFRLKGVSVQYKLKEHIY